MAIPSDLALTLPRPVQMVIYLNPSEIYTQSPLPLSLKLHAYLVQPTFTGPPFLSIQISTHLHCLPPHRLEPFRIIRPRLSLTGLAVRQFLPVVPRAFFLSDCNANSSAKSAR
jgi:hypothetical protein